MTPDLPIRLLDRYAREAAARGCSVDELPPDVRDAAVRQHWSQEFPGHVSLGTFRRPGWGPVEVVEYDENWPATYDVWRVRIVAALGPLARRIEHVGSTSVPGLAAKPIIDVQVSVADVTDEAAYVPALTTLGLELRGRDDVHRFLRDAAEPRTVHVHVCTVGSDWEREHLAFRDALRADDRLRESYAALKWELARRWPLDRAAYTDAKTAFVLDASNAPRGLLTERSAALPAAARIVARDGRRWSADP